MNWPNAELSDDEFRILDMLAEKITYLGRAESPCVTEVITEIPLECEASDYYTKYEPKDMSSIVSSSEISLDILCPVPSSSADELAKSLEVTSKHVRTKMRRRLPPGTELVTYVSPSINTIISKPTLFNEYLEVSKDTNAVIFNIFTNALPSLYSGIIMAEALRKAAMSNYGRHFDGAASANLSGKNSEGQPLGDLHLHSHYLPLKSPDSQMALLNKLVVWCPAGFNANEILALSSIRELGGANFLAARDFRPCRLGFEGYGNISDIAPWIVSKDGSTRWQSLTPFCSSRPAEWRTPSIGEIKRSVKKECAYRGLPEPVNVERLTGNWNAYRTYRQTGSTRGLRNAKPAYGFRIEFSEPIHGPVSVGALSHFGLGLFIPIALG